MITLFWFIKLFPFFFFLVLIVDNSCNFDKVTVRAPSRGLNLNRFSPSSEKTIPLHGATFMWCGT